MSQEQQLREALELHAIKNEFGDGGKYCGLCMARVSFYENRRIAHKPDCLLADPAEKPSASVLAELSDKLDDMASVVDKLGTRRATLAEAVGWLYADIGIARVIIGGATSNRGEKKAGPATPASSVKPAWRDEDLQARINEAVDETNGVTASPATVAGAAPEVGWLVEDEFDFGRLCIGLECGNKLSWVTFTNENAIRFARKRDAENAITVWKLNGIAREHSWG